MGPRMLVSREMTKKMRKISPTKKRFLRVAMVA